MEHEELQPLGRARGRTRCGILSSPGTQKLQSGVQEENSKPLGKCRGRAKRPDVLVHGIPVRQPHHTVTGIPLLTSPTMKVAALKYTKTDRDEEKEMELEPTKVNEGDAHTSIFARSFKVEKGLAAMGIDDVKISPKVQMCGKSMEQVGDASEHEKMQKGPSWAVEPIVWTKPKGMVDKKGTTGQVVSLHANYFKLPTVTNWQLYQYRVDFQPEEDRNAIKKKMVRDNKEKLGGYLFDGSVLFTSQKYHPDPMVIFSNRPSDGAKVLITIRGVGIVTCGDYHYVHIFNLLMRRCLDNLNLQLVGRHYFDSSARITLNKHQLEIWPGYVTSIRQHESEMLLCTEITHKVMRKDTAYNLLRTFYNSDPSDYQRLFKHEILGSIVLTDYNNRTYRVDDVDFSVNPSSTFEWNGKKASYAEYFFKKYDLKISDGSQPMLVSMPKQHERQRGRDTPIYLVPELCRMTGLSEQMRTNFPLMRDLADCTRLVPSQRMERLQHFNRRLKTNNVISEELKSWNMEMSDRLMTLSGRIMPHEKIILGTQVKCDAGPLSDWTRELRSHAMLVSQEVTSWVVIVPRHLSKPAREFESMLRRAAYSMELRLPIPTYKELPDDRLATYVQGIESALLSCNPKLIFVVLPNNRLDRYSVIKKKCCVDCPVPTQLILHKTLINKNVKSVASKVAIQINCKIGGAPWTVEIPLQGLMVVGYDVYHDSLQQGMSIGALVASLDKPMSRYFSAISFHRTGEELSNELSVNICKALQKYREYNHGYLPQRIVLYRDGVGEGQIPYVYEHEVAILKARLAKIYGENEYKLGFIIVTKRINTRLFYNGNNPPPGTVVDDVITLPERFDFFLVSQSVRQGTVSPTSYNVISDNLELGPDKIQRLTYKLTHLYFNWSGTVRVPAPCQYAHKLAYLVGQAIHKVPSTQLEDTLYFL
ncbi:piwi-like protein Siwi isoform X2 [Zootermopsis nevadensis]|nr:piwi-like protein Siwi isoform X2 [Zootermopsis nevadensis]